MTSTERVVVMAVAMLFILFFVTVITFGIDYVTEEQKVKVAPDNTVNVDAWGYGEGLDVYYIEDSNVTCFIYTASNKAGLSCLEGDLR